MADESVSLHLINSARKELLKGAEIAQYICDKFASGTCR